MRIRPDTPRTAHAGKSLQYYTVDTGVGCLLRTGRDDRRGNNGTLYRYVANQCRAGRSRHTGILGCYAHELEGCNSVLGDHAVRRVIAGWQHGCTFRGSGATCSFDTDEGCCWACPD